MQLQFNFGNTRRYRPFSVPNDRAQCSDSHEVGIVRGRGGNCNFHYTCVLYPRQQPVPGTGRNTTHVPAA